MDATPLAIVLAAGQGTRMKSDLPKVLCPVLGRPMIEFVLDALSSAGIRRVIAVVGYRADDVKAALAARSAATAGAKSNGSLEFVLQTERLGTGHATRMAADH